MSLAQFYLRYLDGEIIIFYVQWMLLPPANEVCEGYVFTGVCLSTGGGRAWQGVVHGGGGMHGGGCVCVGGMHGGGCAWLGACMVGACMTGGHVWHACPPPRTDTTATVNERAVRILLECILVTLSFYYRNEHMVDVLSTLWEFLTEVLI